MISVIVWLGWYAARCNSLSGPNGRRIARSVITALGPPPAKPERRRASPPSRKPGEVM